MVSVVHNAQGRLRGNLTHEASRLEAILRALEPPRRAMASLNSGELEDSLHDLEPLIIKGDQLRQERLRLFDEMGLGGATSRELGSRLTALDPELGELFDTVRPLLARVADAVRGVFVLGRFQRAVVDDVFTAIFQGHEAEARQQRDEGGLLLNEEA